MSHKDTSTFCFVIDTSIARAAGDHETAHPRGIQCRNFLMAIRGVCHRMAWGSTIEAEWLKHRSTFALQWLTSMQNLRKLRIVDDSVSTELQQQIERCSKDAGVIAAILKDAHLVVAALRSDGRVASSDDAVRGHLARCLADEPGIASLLWVNPTKGEETPVEWLSVGAPAETHRTLLQFSKTVE